MVRNRFGSMALALPLLVSLGASASFAATTVTQQGADQWRASKLVGVSIYGPDNKTVGKIDDVIIGKDGKAQLVVVGVGGFLGIGSKDVAIPYDQVKFSDQPVLGTTASTAPAGGGGMSPGTGAGTGGASSTTGATPPAANANMAANQAHDTSYPDHGMIDMTYDQLKSAPDFKFAS